MLGSGQVDFDIGVTMKTAIDIKKGTFWDRRASARVLRNNLMKDPETFINVHAFEPKKLEEFTTVKE